MDLGQYLPAILLLVVGFVLVVIEMYVPGFGIPGILGGILLIAGVIAAKPTPLQALLMAVVIVVLLGVALSIFIHSASNGRLSKSALVLKEVATRAGNDSELGYFVGMEGTTRTALRPAGIAEFDDVKLNVLSDGEFIEAGKPVRITHLEGNRIVVEEKDGAEIDTK